MLHITLEQNRALTQPVVGVVPYQVLIVGTLFTAGWKMMPPVVRFAVWTVVARCLHRKALGDVDVETPGRRGEPTTSR